MNIGFLAMSGIRAHDPKLLALGLTLPGFVERSKTVASLPSLGLLYLAACTPDGHALAYFEAESDGSEPPEVYACDLVAISTFSAQVFEAYAIADRLRAAHVKVAIGGLHASVCPEEALEHADYVIIGEGENVWPDVVRAAQENDSRRVFRACDHAPVDVASLPSPRPPRCSSCCGARSRRRGRNTNTSQPRAPPHPAANQSMRSPPRSLTSGDSPSASISSAATPFSSACSTHPAATPAHSSSPTSSGSRWSCPRGSGRTSESCW